MSTHHVVKYRRQHKRLSELSDEQTRHGFEHRIYVQRSQSDPSDPVYRDVWNLYDPFTNQESKQDISGDKEEFTEEPASFPSLYDGHIQVHHPHTAVGHTTEAPDGSDVNHWQSPAIPRDGHLVSGRGPPSGMPSSALVIPSYGGQLFGSIPSASNGFPGLPNEEFRHAMTSPVYPISTGGTPCPPQESWSHANPEHHHTPQGMTHPFYHGISSSSYAIPTGSVSFPLSAMQEPSALYEPLYHRQMNLNDFSQSGLAQIDGRMCEPQVHPMTQCPSGQTTSSWGMDPVNMSDWTRDNHMPSRTTHMAPSLRWQHAVAEFGQAPPATNYFAPGGTSSSDLQYQQLQYDLQMPTDTLMVDHNLTHFGGQNLPYSTATVTTLPWPDQGLGPGSPSGHFPSQQMGNPTFHINMESNAYPQNGYFYGSSSTQKDFH